MLSMLLLLSPFLKLCTCIMRANWNMIKQERIKSFSQNTYDEDVDIILINILNAFNVAALKPNPNIMSALKYSCQMYYAGIFYFSKKGQGCSTAHH